MSEERLKRIEILLETCAKTTVANQEGLKELRVQVQKNSEHLGTLTEMFIESIGVMKTMQSEIKGLQTENNRILDHLFGNNQN